MTIVSVVYSNTSSPESLIQFSHSALHLQRIISKCASCRIIDIPVVVVVVVAIPQHLLTASHLPEFCCYIYSYSTLTCCCPAAV